jgi:L-seryl-tRNA(Ser) seleniumtransferase
VGFTTEPNLQELVELGCRQGVPVVDDLGSGALYDTSRYGLGHEPTVQESLNAGADLVAFSGDKLLGGPQAGILVGDRDLLRRLSGHPLARTLRPDKLCLAALTATLIHYMRDEALVKVPIWRMIATPPDQLRARADRWQSELGQGQVIPGRSTVGGGSLPEETLPTWLLALEVESPDALARELRAAQPPVVSRIQEDLLVLDPRTVMPEQDQELLSALGSRLKDR